MDVVFDDRMTELAATAPVMVAEGGQLIITWPGITEAALLSDIADVAPELDPAVVQDAYVRARLTEHADGEAAAELAAAPTVELPALAMAGPATPLPPPLPPLPPLYPPVRPAGTADTVDTTAPQLPVTALPPLPRPHTDSPTGALRPHRPPRPAPMHHVPRHITAPRPWIVVVLGLLLLLAARPVSTVTGIPFPGAGGPAGNQPAQPAPTPATVGGRRTRPDGGAAAQPGGAVASASASLSASPDPSGTVRPSPVPGSATATSAAPGGSPSPSPGLPPTDSPSPAGPTPAPTVTPPPTADPPPPPDTTAPTDTPPDTQTPPVQVGLCVPGVISVGCP